VPLRGVCADDGEGVRGPEVNMNLFLGRKWVKKFGPSCFTLTNKNATFEYFIVMDNPRRI